MGALILFFKQKIKASSLTEVIVATSILLLVFVISLEILNTAMISAVQNETQAMETKVGKLCYEYRYDKIKVPNSYLDEEFLIEISMFRKNECNWIAFEIKNEATNKRIKRILVAHETK
jgi:hypothetical protein